MNDQGLVNLRWAHALLDGLSAAGVSHVLISPGSRSTPLVLAARRHPRLRTRVLLDERTAAFFALGQAKAGHRPSALIATSGSAPTHWYPALAEAAAAHLPMLLLSADRPAELQDWGANQTLDQQRLFSGHVRAFHQAGLPEDDADQLRQIRQLGIKAVEQSLWPRPGPVHLNLPFREPLVPAADTSHWPDALGEQAVIGRPGLQPDPRQIAQLADMTAAGSGLIVCGGGVFSTDFAAAVTDLAAHLHSPILADPLSGLRFGPWDRRYLISDYDTLLRRGAAAWANPAWLLRFGAPPVSKALLGYLQEQDCPQALVAPHGDWPDPLHRTRRLLRGEPERVCRLLQQATPGASLPPAGEDRTGTNTGPAGGEDREIPLEGRIIQRLIACLPANALLFCGNSLPIRQLDSWSGSGERLLRIAANRGLSGIDGNLASLLGMASVSTAPVVGLIGDLTLLHDLNSLMAAPGLNAVIIVFNNRGGAIFTHLPQSRLADFETLWLTPHTLDLQRLGETYPIQCRRIDSEQAFKPALQDALAAGGVRLLEIPIDPRTSLRQHQAFWAGAASIATD